MVYYCPLCLRRVYSFLSLIALSSIYTEYIFIFFNTFSCVILSNMVLKFIKRIHFLFVYLLVFLLDFVFVFTSISKCVKYSYCIKFQRHRFPQAANSPRVVNA